MIFFFNFCSTLSIVFLEAVSKSLLDRVLHNVANNTYGLGLSKRYTIPCLLLARLIPPHVHHKDVIRGCEIQSDSTCSQTDQHDTRRLPTWTLVETRNVDCTHRTVDTTCSVTTFCQDFWTMFKNFVYWENTTACSSSFMQIKKCCYFCCGFTFTIIFSRLRFLFISSFLFLLCLDQFVYTNDILSIERGSAKWAPVLIVCECEKEMEEETDIVMEWRHTQKQRTLLHIPLCLLHPDVFQTWNAKWMLAITNHSNIFCVCGS